MLAFYSSLIKKEDLLERIGLDAEQIAVLANDLVCDVKSAAAASKSKDIENLLDSIDKAQELVKIVNAMLDNLKNNSVAYVSALVPIKQEEIADKAEKDVAPNKEEQSPEQITSLVEALKSLKQIQESFNK